MGILITGGKGLVARHLDQTLTRRGHIVHALSKEALDVTDYKQCRWVVDRSVDLIIHAGAYTAVDKAEDERDKVNLINVSGTRNLAARAAYLGIPMLFFSTGSVFNGYSNRPYTIWDKEQPTSIYAESKLKAEKEVKSLLNKHYIFRMMHIYGSGRSDFVTQTIDKLKNQDNPSISVIPQVLNITHAGDIANAVSDLIESDRYGTYHYNNEGQTDREGIVKFIAETLGVTEYSISNYEGKLAHRPFYSILDNSEIKMVLKKPIPTWQDSLRKFIECTT